MDTQQINSYLNAVSNDIIFLFEKIKSNRLTAWAIAFFSLFNWRLGKAVADATPFEIFILDFILISVLWCGFILFFIPLVHSIAEKNNPSANPIFVGETAKNINLSTIILIPFMPVTMIIRAIGGIENTPVILLLKLADLLFRLALLWNITSVIKKTYRIKRLSAFFVLLSPIWFLTTWLTIASIFFAILILLKFL